MYLPRRASRVLIRAVDLLQGRGVWSAYREMAASQWWDPERLRRFQDQKLRRRLAGAARGSALMASRFRDAGAEPERGRKALERLPVLERDEIRRQGGALRASGSDGALPNSTGGSTGANIEFWVDRECWRWRDAADLRLWSFLGLEPGATAVTVWGSPMDSRAAGRLRERLRRVVDNRRFFSAYKVGEAELDPLLDWLARRRPDALFGYASVLDRLARRARARGGMPGPARIISSAEALFPDQRQRMEAAWGAPVHNLYGCREVGLVALECEAHQGLHVMEERLLVELSPVPEGERDAPADLLLTDLDNAATPFVRYRIGDLARPGPVPPCPCGRGLSRLGEITGRSFDVVRGPQGQAVGGTFWSLLLRTGVRGVETFQVVQHALDRLEIRVTPEGCLGEEGRAALVERIRAALGEEMQVEFRELASLDPLPSGKHRFVVSRIGGDEPGKTGSGP